MSTIAVVEKGNIHKLSGCMFQAAGRLSLQTHFLDLETNAQSRAYYAAKECTMRCPAWYTWASQAVLCLARSHRLCCPCEAMLLRFEV